MWIKRLNNSESGDSTHIGGDNWDALDKYFDNTDISSSITNPTKILTPTTFRDQILKISNAGQTASYTIKAGTISSNQTLTLPDLSGAGTLMAAGSANDFGTAAQTFRSTFLIMRNPANTSSYIHTTSAIAANRVVTWPLLTSDDEVMFKNFAQTPTNKTWHINTNTLKHSTTNAQGDILYYDTVTGGYKRLARGTASQTLSVNAGGTDIEWSTVGAGTSADKVKVYEGGSLVGSVARKLNFSATDFNVTEDSGNDELDIELATVAGSGISVLSQSNAETDVVNTTTETDILNYTVTGNTLGTTKKIKVEIMFDYFNNSGASRTFVISIYFGGTLLFAETSISVGADADIHTGNLVIQLWNLSATNANRIRGYLEMSGASAPSTGLAGNFNAANGDIYSSFATSNGTKDTTSNQILKATVTHSAANASLSFKVINTNITLIG